MKQLLYISTFLVLMSCGQTNSEQKGKQKNSVETQTKKTDNKSEITEPDDQAKSKGQADFRKQTLNYEFKKATIFQLTDTIKADFNGDGNIDQATFIKENETSGIIIRHGKTNEEVRIGFGEPFAHLTEFNWVDFWGLVNDTETYEIVIEDAEIIGDRTVELENPSIVVRKKEVGGGLITFKDGKYQWIHQSD